MRARVAVGAAALLLAGCTSGGNHPAPPAPAATTYTPISDGIGVQRLHGMPLPGNLGVRIVDGNKLINLDTRRAKKIAGLPGDPQWVTAYRIAGTDVLATPNDVFVLHDNKAWPIAGNVSAVAPGRNGIWLTRGTKKCTLTEVALSGRTIVPARPLNCDYGIRYETARGLVASTNTGEVLLDKRLRPITSADEIAAAGTELITGDDQQISIAGRGSVPLPSTIGSLEQIYVSPDNRYAAVDFGDPSCPGPRQCLDTWVLRLADMHWIHPPSMPVSMYLKPHYLYWSTNDRFTWLGTFDGIGGAIVTWQPGATALRIRQISLPASQYGVLRQ